MDNKARATPSCMVQSKIEISLESSLTICKEISHVNQDVIEQCCSDGHLMSLKLNDKLIGFATWIFITPYGARIQLVEIDKSFRKRKFGSILINHLLDYFIKTGCLVVDLQCSPIESEKFWKNQGFKEFPPDARFEATKQLYKILVPTLKPSKSPNLNRIELVNDYGKLKGKWIWNLQFIKGTNKLKKPIIFPSNDEWRLY